MEHTGFYRRFSLGLIALLFFLGQGCENTLSPFSERGAYSVYGALTLTSGPHFVRVKPLERPIREGAARPLDATVTLTNLSDGTTTTLQDSIIIFGGEAVTHNYWARLEVQPDTKYRLTIENPNGSNTQVTATTPVGLDARSRPSQGHCLIPFTVTFPRAARPYRTQIGFEYGGETFWSSNRRPSSLPTRSTKGIRFTTESLLSSVIPSVDKSSTPFQYEPRCWKLDSRRIRVAYTYLGPNWFGEAPAPGTTFDPTESSRVENGLGFFGAYRRDTIAVTVDTSGTISLR